MHYCCRFPYEIYKQLLLGEEHILPAIWWAHPKAPWRRSEKRDYLLPMAAVYHASAGHFLSKFLFQLMWYMLTRKCIKFNSFLVHFPGSILLSTNNCMAWIEPKSRSRLWQYPGMREYIGKNWKGMCWIKSTVGNSSPTNYRNSLIKIYLKKELTIIKETGNDLSLK